MATAIIDEHPLTITEFLAQPATGDERLELIDGQVVAMSRPSPRHSAMAGEIGGVLRTRLRDRGGTCRLYAEASVRLEHDDHTLLGPDLAVSCSPDDLGGNAIVCPVLIVEVLSPSTAGYDSTAKAAKYKQIPSLTDLLLVSSTERRVIHWRRQPPFWTAVDYLGEGTLSLASIGAELTLDELYDTIIERAG